MKSLFLCTSESDITTYINLQLHEKWRSDDLKKRLGKYEGSLKCNGVTYDVELCIYNGCVYMA